MFNIPEISDPRLRALLGMDDPAADANAVTSPAAPVAGYAGDASMAPMLDQYATMGRNPADRTALLQGVLSPAQQTNLLTPASNIGKKAKGENQLSARPTTLADLYRQEQL